MATRLKVAFGLLIAAQAAHSLEEYVGRLWESFPPATFLTGLVSANHELGFIVISTSLVAFGLWCLAWPVAREWPSAPVVIWAWIAISFINGIGHPMWTARQGGYTPGVVTALLLLGIAAYLAVGLARQSARRPSSA
jgi:hypothetical protein